ncbi:MAG: glycosyltransferase [Crocinitomix sp.]|nr:glycosyltransferase [Crocinitomix sp.]
MQKHKVIHVIYSGLGGHANVVFPLLESEFGEKHTHVLVFFGVEETLPDYLVKSEELGIKTYSIQKKPRKYLKAFSRFKEILELESPDRIIVHSSELIMPAKIYSEKKPGVKVFYAEHENNQSKGRSLRMFSKYALRKADAVVCLNDNYKAELQKKYKCKVPIHVIHNGVDTDKFKPTKDKKATPIVIGMASRMIPGKDHINLLKAFKSILKNHPNTELHLAGEGETFEKVKALSISLELQNNVQFLGLLNEVEMLAFYSKIHTYVLATHAETLSTAILQAMSCGLPVLTSDIPNNKLLIQPNETGWLYKDKNSLDLADQLNEMLSDLTVANKIGEKARAAVIERYSIKTNAQKYTELIQ